MKPNVSAFDGYFRLLIFCIALMYFTLTGVCIVGDSEKFKHGVYKMQVEWKTDNDTYYTEGVIKIK